MMCVCLNEYHEMVLLVNVELKCKVRMLMGTHERLKELFWWWLVRGLVMVLKN